MDQLVDLLDLTLPGLAENLALDEALLDQAEAGGQAGETLRLWEAPAPMVVLGRASRTEQEVDLVACQRDQVPLFRRVSGGTTVVAGPGCLMYAVVLSYDKRPHLRGVDQAHEFVMSKLASALATLVDGVTLQGTCDLVWRNRKVSGNSLRCKRSYLLYHGTVLYDFPLATISRWLRTPPRQPAYRAQRSHSEFLVNLPVSSAALRAAIQQVWQADTPLVDHPKERVGELVRRQYSQSSWTWRL